MMLRHARMQLEFKGEYLGIREMRKHVAWYVKGMKGAAKFPSHNIMLRLRNGYSDTIPESGCHLFPCPGKLQTFPHPLGQGTAQYGSFREVFFLLSGKKNIRERCIL